MKVVERLVPLYAWFGIGYGVISLFMAVVNFGMLLLTLLTVRGIIMPAWFVVVVALLISCTCIGIGGFFVTYNFQSRVTSYLNCDTNPELHQIAQDVKWLRERVKE